MDTTSRRKGVVKSLAGVGIVILAVGVFGLNMQLGEELKNLKIASVNDIDRISTAKAEGDSFYHDFIPAATFYSLHQSGYVQGKDGGGSVDWTYSKVDNSGFRERIFSNYDQNASEYLEENYLKSATLERCGIASFDYKLEPSRNKNHKKKLQALFDLEGDSFKVLCEFEDGDVKYNLPVDSQLTVKAKNNRYFWLVRRTHDFFKNKVKPRMSLVKDSYTERVWNCGSPSGDSKALKAAINTASGDISWKKKSLGLGSVEGNGFEVVKFNLRSYGGTYPGTSINRKNFRLASKSVGSGVNTGVPCGLDDDKDFYTKSATVSPKYAEVEFVLRDKRYQVPTEDGWKHLEFRVKYYRHNFQND